MSRGVFISFMGLGGHAFSSGMAKLAERMEREGWQSATYRWNEHDRALAEFGDHDGPIVLAGHSAGATGINEFADGRGALGKHVDTGIFVDAWFPLYANSAFRRVISIKADNFGRFHVKGGNVVDFKTIEDTSHTTVDDDEEVVNLVIGELSRLAGEGSSAGSPAAQVTQWTGNRFDRKTFFDAVREAPFNGRLTQRQVDGMEQLLAVWEDRFRQWDMRELAYDLATAWWETGKTMMPETENGSREYFSKYEGRESLGNTEPGDGFRFRGMGHVQSTGRRNARKQTEELKRFDINIDFEANPEKRLEPLVSALSLFAGNHEGWWTGKRLPNFAGYGNWDMKGARSVVNGTDRWQEIGEAAGQFLDALKLSALPQKPQAPLPAPVDPSQPVPASPAIPDGDLAGFLAGRYPETTEQARTHAAMLADALAYRLGTMPGGSTPMVMNMAQPERKTLMKSIDGFKTHIVAVMVALIAILEGYVGVDIPGAEMQANWFEYVLAALGLSSMRDGLRKVTEFLGK